jgi:putative oxidoreductase
MTDSLKQKPGDYVVLICRVILGSLFIYMGVSKTDDPILFMKLIREFQIIDSPYLLTATAALLPWFEIVCGLFVLLGITTRASALIILSLLIGFTSMIMNRAFGIRTAEEIAFCAISFDCGCGGGEINICKKLTQNLALIALSVAALFPKAESWSIRPHLLSKKNH